MRRLGRQIVLLLVLAVLHAGPVAACICADDASMPAMPCCPDQGADFGHTDHAVPPSADVACDTVAVSLIPASSPDVPAPIGIPSAEPPARLTHAPPPLRSPLPPAPLGAEPLYLVTLRLRI